MPRIDLDEICPEELTFVYRGKEYHVDGDIDVETTFDIIQLYEEAVAVEQTGDLPARRAMNLKVRDRLLALFQEREPTLERLPFGSAAYRAVLAEVLIACGLEIQETPPVPARPKPKPRRRSSGSPRS